ncbi:VMAP-C domain-containing protein [Actinomadura monticuli]|uniref:Trypsin-like peptidase domain-containing protein n=1 Tax=Actinomadura monticuli TaxID=3097367 RepID=A0ABV4QN50_9ACTN
MAGRRGVNPLTGDAAIDGRTELARLLDACVVLFSGDEVRGSGVLVAPRTVLTCAHVVARYGNDSAQAVQRTEFQWRGAVYSGTVRAVPDQHRGRGLWGYPDLALVTADALPDDHPYAWLGTGFPRDHTSLYATGFKATYGEGDMELGGTWVKYDSPHDVFGRPMLSLSQGELASGMSGGPLLDPATGAVCGILTTSRKEGWSQGGLGTPIEAVWEAFGDICESGQPPQNARWRSLRNGILRREELVKSARDSLVALLTDSPLSLYALYDRVFDGLRLPPDNDLRTPEDLIREVADSVPVPGRPDPLTRLRAEAKASAVRPPAPRSARIEIHLVPAGHDARRLLLSVWTYQRQERVPVMEHCADGAMPVEDVREGLRSVLRDVLRRLVSGHGPAVEDLVVEFVMPFEMLGDRDGRDAVDEWYIDKPHKSLGVQFPVIVRTRDRPYDALVHLRRRWRSLQSSAPVLYWADCQAEKSMAEFYGSFQNSEPCTMVMIGYRPGEGRRRQVLEAAYDAGLPVAVWRRRPCDGSAASTCGRNGTCAAETFQRAVEARLAGRPLAELPALIRTLRAEAQTQGRDTEHCGRGLSVLLDDPTRPDPDSAALSNPQ